MSAVRRLGRILDPKGQVRLAEGFGGDVQPVQGSLFGDLVPDGPRLAAADVRWLAPVVPSKVVGVGSNYRAHALEMGKPVPPVPKLFLKPSTSIIGPDDPILIPPGTERVDHEAEIGIVIGRTLSRGRHEDVLDHVLGLCCLNDVTARDFQQADGQFTRGKGFDTFCPIGPWIVTGLDASNLRVRASVNGKGRQDGHSSDMVFGPRELLVFISGIMTLLPGDIIATGTPSGVGPLLPGDRVSIDIEGVGSLENPVAARDDRA